MPPDFVVYNDATINLPYASAKETDGEAIAYASCVVGLRFPTENQFGVDNTDSQEAGVDIQCPRDGMTKTSPAGIVNRDPSCIFTNATNPTVEYWMNCDSNVRVQGFIVNAFAHADIGVISATSRIVAFPQ